ncbi:MAG TPA: hypothetical protein VHC50_06165 [Puia sp.]|nr:hypothetical protein [Puia sp.]
MNIRILGRKEKMTWKTIYITGRGDFREEVKRKLEHSDQRYLPGFIESAPGDVTHDLYWIDGRTNLHTFKRAIGGKLIWKYRMRFFTTLEEFMASQESADKNEFTEKERRMIEEMQQSAA